MEVFLTAVPKVPRTVTSINDNYGVTDPVLTTRSLNVVYLEAPKTVNIHSDVNCSVASRVPCNKQCKAATKERLKSSLKNQRNKFCELCFFCRSLCFCPNCAHCPQCCSCSTSRQTPSALLADLGPPRSKCKSGFHPKGGVCATIQTQTPSSQTPPDSQWLCQSQQKQVSKGGGSKPSGQKGSRDGVDHCVSAPTVPITHNVVPAPLVGRRLQPFWQTWARLGANSRVVSILKEGYVLPFKLKPPLVRHPLIVSGYANPNRNKFLREAVQNLVDKKAVEMVSVRASLAFFNRLFIVPKPNQKWRPVLDLSALNKFLSVKTFKMETPETIRVSLQQGEWVTSLDFSDAYFHIPIHSGSRKYLRFHFQNQSYQFRALPFGL